MTEALGLLFQGKIPMFMID